MPSALQIEFADAFSGCKVLVTGATGFVGRALCEALLSLGADVHGLSRSISPAATNVAPWRVDLRDTSAVQQTCDTVAADYVFHLAGQVTARQELELVGTMCQHNLLGTINLMLALARGKPRRIVVAGTPEHSAEDVRGATVVSPYAASKAAAAIYAQMFCHLYHLPIITVRPFLTYGPGQSAEKLLPYTILKMLNGESPRLTSGKRLCDFIYVADVVGGMLRAALAPDIEGQTLDLGTGRPTSIRTAVECAARQIDVSFSVSFGAIPDRFGEPPLIADAEATSTRIAWKAKYSLEAGLRETVAWYREHASDFQSPSADCRKIA